ncbi:cytochrome c oxidase subunit 5B [Plasmodium gonderi]|uniref:Cytochrome c oxidase subunit 5B n=1 Tax=Plasmodium gonderi TaxID=77519 RepID=A0A1Y1JCT4_PLAGO|nr:cytochrome c oxidase subunit 5B [Plasmodium gonderi]GAW80341.1 cytochrome c oxidase subunit 5B [Plasmodium gonderi]
MDWRKSVRILSRGVIGDIGRSATILNICDGRKYNKIMKKQIPCFQNNIQKRNYLHFARTLPEDYELPLDTFPDNISEILKKDKKSLDFIQSYWYWKIRSESNLLNYKKLVNKSYKQLAVDMGMQIANPDNEHMLALLEFYEYLKSSPFVGPFGTIENPVIVPSVHTERVVCCTGGTGENEHVPLFFRCREGFLYRCGECDQIFMHVRVLYSLEDGNDPFPNDPDVDDVFDLNLIEENMSLYNDDQYVRWPTGNVSYRQMFLQGKWGNEKPNNASYIGSEK